MRFHELFHFITFCHVISLFGNNHVECKRPNACVGVHVYEYA